MDWKYGDRMIVAPPVPTDEAKTKYEDFQIKALPSGKESARCEHGECRAEGCGIPAVLW